MRQLSIASPRTRLEPGCGNTPTDEGLMSVLGFPETGLCFEAKFDKSLVRRVAIAEGRLQAAKLEATRLGA